MPIASYAESDIVRDALARCDAAIVRHDLRSPRECFLDLAQACARWGLEEWDCYAGGGAVQLLEDRLRALLGTEDVTYFPSGIMAQQVALRVHSDHAGCPRVAVPDLSHLLLHEEDGPRLVHGLQLEHLTRGAVTPTTDHLDRLPGRLAAAVVELPLRDGASLLPTWEELCALSDACRGRGIRLHFDGARLWEAQPWFGRTFGEIVALSDSTYVSLYKGLGGLTGAALAGSTDFVQESRLWRRRMGGTLYRSTPEVVAALVGLDELLPLLPRTVAWARELTDHLPRGVRVRPRLPQTNTFVLYADGDADPINKRLAAYLTETRLALTKSWRPSEVPGVAMTEMTIGIGALDHEPGRIAEHLASVVIGESSCGTAEPSHRTAQIDEGEPQ